MRTEKYITILGLVVGQAAIGQPSNDPRAAMSEALIDAFYSFDPQRLKSAMSAAPSSAPLIVYYQGWAKGGNYRVLNRRPCIAVTADKFRCDITVKDDLITALGTGYDVTDSFHITFDKGAIVEVKTSSNDPPEFDEALKWVADQRPELMEGPCRGFFAGGPTPEECVREVGKGFRLFAKR